MDVTIAIPISRKNFLRQLFESLESLECDINHTSLLCYVDGSLDLLQRVKPYFAQSKFTSKKLIYRNHGIGSTGSVKRRRQRIADIHNEMKGLIGESDYVFLIEDDTIVPPNALSVLLDDHNLYPNAGFVSGIELGRWGFPIIGAWISESKDEIYSVPLESSIKKVTATGLYCCLVKRGYYLTHTFAPFEEILGPDVNFGKWISSMGKDNYIDYNIKCVHLTERMPISFANVKPIQIKFTRDRKIRIGWKQEVIK